MNPHSVDGTAVHKVFPGITLTYSDVSAPSAAHSGWRMLPISPAGNTLQIRHCLEGRMECEAGSSCFYLSPGDMAITPASGHAVYFPCSRYRGLSISIDADLAPACLSCLLDDVNVQPSALIQKFCGESDCFVMRANPSLEHLFSELYSVPDSIKNGYFKVKVLELLLFLSVVNTNENQARQRSFTHSQVLLAKQVCCFLSSHMDTHITIGQLAEFFHVSPTQLKNSFKGVYGVSVYTYIRTQKMHAAAVMLQQTDHTVLDIAGRFGYDNASKFAKAFREVLGVSPNSYRLQTAEPPDQIPAQMSNLSQPQGGSPT